MTETAVLQSIARLENDADFAAFMDEVKRRREAARDEMEHATDPWMAGRSQGESRLASDLIELVSGARKALQQRQQRGN